MSSTPPPPPPLPRQYRGIAARQESDKPVATQKDAIFNVKGDAADSAEIEFLKAASDKGSIPLRAVIGQYLDMPHLSRVSVQKLYQILGRLRCLQYALKQYNTGLSTLSEAFLQHWRQHTLNTLSGFGYSVRPGAEVDGIQIPGLDRLIASVEEICSKGIAEARQLINAGKLSFASLSELFTPDAPVKAFVIPDASVPCVFRVTDAYYEERRALFGSQQNFHVTFEFVVAIGNHFSIASFSEVFSAWSGMRTRNLADFVYQPTSDVERKTLLARATAALNYAGRGAKYLAYAPGSFFMHTPRLSNTMSSPRSAQSLPGGRIMIDTARAASLGHHPCQGIDEATLSIINLSSRYRNHINKRSSEAETSLILWEAVPRDSPDLLMSLWPALAGFSFTNKAWGHVLTPSLSPIPFSPDAFSSLALPESRKVLLRALIRNPPSTNDLVAGKLGGLVFLLHGPPGVGKTLTAETVAEHLEKPLYYVTMGELGTTPEELETRLGDILSLCAGWDAVALLDEADVFLEARGEGDMLRNAVVCVLLRMLEYYPGILFLTTNRVRMIDPAFESRISVAFKYEGLDVPARKRVWEMQIGMVRGVEVEGGIDLEALAGWQLNGRQIKNAVNLGCALAAEQRIPLGMEVLKTVLDVTMEGRRMMREDDTWERLGRAATAT